MSKVLNLDELVKDDKIVVIEGKEYIIPAEAPLDIMLRIMKTSNVLDGKPGDAEAHENAFRSLHAMFAIKQPELEFENFKRMITPTAYLKIVQFIYDQLPEDKKKETEASENVET